MQDDDEMLVKAYNRIEYTDKYIKLAIKLKG
jgi:hypothetical protein